MSFECIKEKKIKFGGARGATTKLIDLKSC